MTAIAVTKTTIGLNLLRDGRSGAQNPKITYISLGSSANAPAAGDTQLGAEFFRKAVATYTNSLTGEIITGVYIAPTDAVGFDIEEVGYWAGTATSAANSGVLIAHGLYPHGTKTALESITIQADEIFS